MTDVSGVLAASIIREIITDMMTEAARTSETFVNSYHTTWHNI
jgi:hypothetical protein